MELKNGEIFSAVGAIKELVGKEWPVKVSLALRKLIQELNDPYVRIDEVRNGLVEKYGTAGEGGNISIAPGDANWEPFVADANELFADSAEVEFEKVELPMAVNGEDVVITIASLEAMETFVAFKE